MFSGRELRVVTFVVALAPNRLAGCAIEKLRVDSQAAADAENFALEPVRDHARASGGRCGRGAGPNERTARELGTELVVEAGDGQRAIVARERFDGDDDSGA